MCNGLFYKTYSHYNDSICEKVYDIKMLRRNLYVLQTKLLIWICFMNEKNTKIYAICMSHLIRYSFVRKIKIHE